MLGKLIKHEFRATSKYMWPIFIGMVLLTALTRLVALPLLSINKNFITNAFAMIILVCFSIGITLLGFAPLLVTSCRFKKNILGNEGYLTMSLPVSSHQLIGAKLITNAVWYAVCGVFFVLLGLVMVSEVDSIPGLFSGFKGLIKALSEISKEEAKMLGQGIFVAFEIFLNLVAGISLLTTTVYASYAIGFSANKRKSLWTVLLIYGFVHVISWVGIGSLLIFGREDMRFGNFYSGMRAFEGFLGCELGLMLLLGVAFYFITNYFITRKLNLE